MCQSLLRFHKPVPDCRAEAFGIAAPWRLRTAPTGAGWCPALAAWPMAAEWPPAWGKGVMSWRPTVEVCVCGLGVGVCVCGCAGLCVGVGGCGGVGARAPPALPATLGPANQARSSACSCWPRASSAIMRRPGRGGGSPVSCRAPCKAAAPTLRPRQEDGRGCRRRTSSCTGASRHSTR